MTKKLVSELEGVELDYWVAKAETKGTNWEDNQNWIEGYLESHSPSTNWNDAGPLIDKYEIDIDHSAVENYPSGFDCGATCLGFVQYGHTALVAVCRSIVFYKFGKYVDSPSHRE